jgi:hypothetical protein
MSTIAKPVLRVSRYSPSSDELLLHIPPTAHTLARLSCMGGFGRVPGEAVWRKNAYVAAPDQNGWQRSRAFGRSFQLTRSRDRRGEWRYALEMKSA